jgi:uncharacterized protein
MKKYIVKGKSEKEIVEKTSSVLGVEIERLRYEVLNVKKGFLGKINEIEMKIWVEVEEEALKMDIKEKLIEVEEKERSVTDYFKIEINKKGIFGMILEEAELKEEEFNKNLLEMFFYLEKREIKNIDKESVRTILLNKSKKPLKIADYIEDYYIDSYFIIEISEDKMEAYLELSEPLRGNDVDYEMILSEIEKKGIKYGVEIEKIKEIILNKIYNKKIIFAKGDLPQKGRDGEIEYRFETDISPKFYIDEMGRVDYKTIINSVKNVGIGDIVAVIIPHEDGNDGKNIFGEIIKSEKGEEKKFIKGDNVIEGMNSNELISMIAGRVTLKKNEINVYPVLEIFGDVDLKSGNIDFFGVVIIKGNVRDGFKVNAKGDIIVEGLVEDAVVTSGGNIFIKSGILGKEGGSGSVKSEGSINTKFIQNMKIEARKNVEVLEHILSSFVEADGGIFALNGKGKIIGGKIIAGKKIAAREVGNMYGVKTEIEIGITEHMYSQKIKIDTEYNGKVDEVEKIEMGLRKVLDNLYWKNPEMDKAKYISDLKKDILRISEEKHKNDEAIKKIKKGEIFIRDTMFRGVVLKIDGVQINSKESFNYVRFYLNDKKEIDIGSFEEDDSR